MMSRIDLVAKGGFKAGTNLITSSVERPKPGKGEVVIDIEASAVNPVDWKIAEYGFMLPADGAAAALGCDVAGVVSAVGEETESTLLGQRVVAYLGAPKTDHATDRGAYGHAVAIDADVAIEIPDNVSFAQAASIPVGAMTAVLLLEELKKTKEDGGTIVIWGASSSVGFNCVQIAVQKYGLEVIAVASAKHAETLQKVGAKYVIDYRSEDVIEAVNKLGITNLVGACDCIGGEETFRALAEILLKNGAGPKPHVVSSVNFGMPEIEGIRCASVDFGSGLTNPTTRGYIKDFLPGLLKTLEYQPIISIKGPVTAETLEKAFQTNKDGVSGAKVVIEWEK